VRAGLTPGSFSFPRVAHEPPRGILRGQDLESLTLYEAGDPVSSLRKRRLVEAEYRGKLTFSEPDFEPNGSALEASGQGGILKKLTVGHCDSHPRAAAAILSLPLPQPPNQRMP
jgi:hypothetical protein